VVEEGLANLPFTEKVVETPLGVEYTGLDFCHNICGVSIVRAGETMEAALRQVVSGIKIGKVLIDRGERTDIEEYKVRACVARGTDMKGWEGRGGGRKKAC